MSDIIDSDEKRTWIEEKANKKYKKPDKTPEDIVASRKHNKKSRSKVKRK